MSSHFNYEIDEKRMRVKLKDMDLPYREEAWIQFEAYCDGCKNTYKSSSLPKFNFNLNRTVILPVVFGIVIILFSMLLFNFVSIKGKPSDNKSAKVIPTKTEPAPEKIIVAAVLKDTAKVVVAEIKDTVKAKEEVVIAPPVVPVAVTPTIMATPTVQNASQAAEWTVAESGDIYSSANIASKVIGSARRNQKYTALEETNYFIKISFGQNETGYFRKNLLRKNGSGNSNQQISNDGQRKRKPRKAEVLESLQAPVNLNGEEKEPELK